MPRVDFPPLIQRLVQQLRRMPGIGPRSAERIALWMVRRKDARAEEIAGAISNTVARIRSCARCGFFSEGEICAICADPERDSRRLCVVEEPTDILSLERSGVFRGLYHSLGGRLSPLDHIGPEDLRIESLVHRVKVERPEELIFALSLDVEGEATLSYIAELIKSEAVHITRIAQGLPVGSGVGSADELTLARAFAGRIGLDQ